MKQKFDVRLSCRCGKVRGLITGVTPGTCNHGVCLCDDCQRYAAFLGTDGILDQNGGTEITQVGHNQVSLISGKEHIACVRLYPKGMHRWYTQCCNTPLVNTMGAKSLFAGVVHTCIDESNDKGSLMQALGPIRERVQGKFGKGELPEGTQKTASVGLILYVLTRLAHWGMTRAYTPSAFFVGGAPLVTPRVLTKSERARLTSVNGEANVTQGVEG